MIPEIMYPALTAELGFSRVYRDYAGDSPTAPYAVWTSLVTVPTTSVSDTATSDTHGVSVDVFSGSEKESTQLIKKARDAIERIGTVETIQSLGYDPATRLWRYTLQGEILLNR